MEKYIKESPILNYNTPAIQKLVAQRGWKQLATTEQVKAIYNYVRDEIKFGYNQSDSITAAQVLSDGYGQCNTKSTLLMALLRAVGVPNRIHGFMIDKALQKGAITGIWYVLTPKNLLHSWVEVYVHDTWYFLEGVILDKKYVTAVQQLHKECKTTFCGYGIFTDDFQNPKIEWDLNHTFIQQKGIHQDLGLFDTPDDFYAIHKQKLNVLKQFVYKNFVRYRMNKTIDKIRK